MSVYVLPLIVSWFGFNCMGTANLVRAVWRASVVTLSPKYSPVIFDWPKA